MSLRRKRVLGRLPERSRRSSGYTLLELTIALPILAVAAYMLLSTIIASSKMRTMSRDNALVAEAIRSTIERMRNEEVEDVFRLYNADPMDDPGGPGTAPGNRFAVVDVIPLEGENGMVGEILLPVVDTSDGPIPVWELREDLEDPALSMPHDLNGDNVIDDLDHADDYELIPIRVRARWMGKLGERSLEMFTILTRFRR